MERALGGAMFVLLASAAHGPAAAPDVPPWLAAVDSIRMLPDPLDARAIGAIDHAPRFSAPRCVMAATIRPGRYSCWAGSGRAGAILQATLDYYSARADGPSSEGQLVLRIAPAPCSTIGQAERALGRSLRPTMPPTVYIPPGGAAPQPGGQYGVRLYGQDMQALMLSLQTDAKGCIVAAVLKR